jgi:hypothetical protein
LWEINNNREGAFEEEKVRLIVSKRWKWIFRGCIIIACDSKKKHLAGRSSGGPLGLEHRFRR